jgi:ABC-type uncharacterized transport system ATPase subunit
MLEIKDLEVYYGAIHAVKGISLRVEDGQIVTLIGSNGAGKSTTLHTISGLIKPRSGSILFDGAEIAGTPAHQIVASGLVQVPEGRHVFANMSVMENLDMGAYLRKDKDAIEKDKNRVFELFPRLFERKNQLSGTLSGGEQQMLAMGRALMERPASCCWMNRPWALPRCLSRKYFPSSRPSTRKGPPSSSWNKMPIWPCPLPITPTSLKRGALPSVDRRLNFLPVRPSARPTWGAKEETLCA